MQHIGTNYGQDISNEFQNKTIVTIVQPVHTADVLSRHETRERMIRAVNWLNDSYSRFVLQLVADVLSVACTDVLHQLLPCRSHLISDILLSIIEDICSKACAEAFLGCRSGTSVALSSASTATASSTVTASTAITSSTSSTHSELVTLITYKGIGLH